ncbi:hypothetical protein [Nocardia araoensis]|uniref:hypothetical protein n=1 Tax=Nocardia araoensis TaxID=228600 RepID=UPI0012F64CFA|nr:hypothetical protein [Nocardia araoensis]
MMATETAGFADLLQVRLFAVTMPVRTVIFYDEKMPRSFTDLKKHVSSELVAAPDSVVANSRSEHEIEDREDTAFGNRFARRTVTWSEEAPCAVPTHSAKVTSGTDMFTVLELLSDCDRAARQSAEQVAALWMCRWSREIGRRISRISDLTA